MFDWHKRTTNRQDRYLGCRVRMDSQNRYSDYDLIFRINPRMYKAMAVLLPLISAESTGHI